ncbi:MAG TPA: DNA polymerase III subunit chi [Marinobacter sp.]|nr:DNA polymerase III subunit chi [Marinobacter sp.]
MQNSKPGDTPDGRNQRYWFHILAQNTPAARNLHAARLADKAWQQGDRVCILCDTEAHAKELDDLLWTFTPEAFLPHGIGSEQNRPGDTPVSILLQPPSDPSLWDTVIVLSSTLPLSADQYLRLALVAHNDPAVLDQARAHYRQLRKLGIEAQVYDMRR